jgi:hypothetical protein
MDFAHHGRDSSSPSPEQLRKAPELAESRSSSTLRGLAVPFSTSEQAKRRNSLEIKKCGTACKQDNQAKDKLLLPSLYPAAKPISRGKSRFVIRTNQTDMVELPVPLIRQNPNRRAPFKPDKGKLLLHGIAVESSSLQRLPKPKYNLASASIGIHVKQHLQASSSSILLKRATIADIYPAPVITLSLVEQIEQGFANPPAVKRMDLAATGLLNPPGLTTLHSDLTCHSTSLLRLPSPLSSASSDYSSGESLNSGYSSDKSVDSNRDIGIWSPWASHLSPFQRIIEIAGCKHTKIYHYLKKRSNRVQIDSETCDLLGPVIKPLIATRNDGISCTCPHPLSSRNLHSFQIQGIARLNLSRNSSKLSSLQTIIAVRPELVRQRVLLIQIDGVIADVRKIDQFDQSPWKYVLRAGVIEGLSILSRSFSLVLLSNLPLLRFQKILDYLMQRKVQILAAYSVQHSEDPLSRCFLDYSSISTDLAIPANQASARLFLLSALLSETETGKISTENGLLYSESGLRIRLNAVYLPVVLPSQASPVVTMLVSHLRVEDFRAALAFTVIANEVLRVSKGSKSLKWADSFERLYVKDASLPYLAYVRTYKVIEAYYAYLLPWICNEDLRSIPLISERKPVQCHAHPLTNQLSKLLPESRLILLTAPSPAALFPCEIIDFEPFSLLSKAVSLLEYTQMHI